MEVSRIRLLRDHAAVWLMYAGSGRRYFDLFRESKSVFLTLPGFEASDAVFESDELMRRHLAMSDQIARWVRGARSDPPSRRASAYDPFPHEAGSPEAKSFAAELGNIQRLFVQAKPGDLILSPPYGHYDPYLIGEITHAWNPEDVLDVPLLMGERVPVRRVRWLNTALARRDFPARVSRRLQNKHAITQVDPSFYEDIFQLVYPSYVWKDSSKIDVFGDDYKGTDPLQIYPSAKMVKYVLASVFAFEKDEFAEFQALPADAAIAAYYDESLIEDFGQNFNSPGKFTIVAALGSLSILAAAGIHVATSGPDIPLPQAQAEASEAVKGAMVGPGKAARSADLDNYIGSMEAVNWNKVRKELGEPAKAQMNVSLSNRVEVARHRAELDDR